MAPRPGTVELNPYCPMCKGSVAKKLFFRDLHGKALTKADQQLGDEKQDKKKARSKARRERRRKAKTEASDDEWNKEELADLEDFSDDDDIPEDPTEAEKKKAIDHAASVARRANARVKKLCGMPLFQEEPDENADMDAEEAVDAGLAERKKQLQLNTNQIPRHKETI